MKHILVVEDEPEITHFLKRGLTYKGFEVTTASSGEQVLHTIQQHPPDLVLLDIRLPDIDGYEVCRRLRTSGHTDMPVLMLTTKDEVTDKITGLDCEADDYITKPFAFEELVARIRAALRWLEYKTSPKRRIQVADLILDTAERQIWRAGHAIELTACEYNLLELLVLHAGQVLTKESIFEHVWGYDHEAGLDIIKVYINSLRSKLNADGRSDLIHTVRGVGYILRP